MPERSYRLKTSSGLSDPVSLDSLRKNASDGNVDADTLCTMDDGKSWQAVAELLSKDTVRALPDRGDDISSASANETAARSSSSETMEGGGPRKLKRLPVSTVKSKYSKRVEETPESRKDSKQKLSALVGRELSNGRYKVLSQFGSGSMAYVFRASDNRLETDVIIKIPKPEKITSDDFRERFRRESQLLVRLSHPHVVKVLDVGETDDLPYVVMQLLSGGTLSDRMAKDSDELNQMSPQSLQTWLREVARALDFCYRKGMVHRDVKPANILFDDDDNPYVSDFGLTKIMHGEHTELCSSGTANGVVLGTPNYLPPEIILGAPYDGRADQYSLALTVYHAMCGRPPMQGKSATATMINQTQKKLELLSSIRTDIPRELALAVQKGIEKSPADRFESSEAFAEAVLECLRNDSSSEILLGGLNAAFIDDKAERDPAPGSSGSVASSGSVHSGSSAHSASSMSRRRSSSSSRKMSPAAKSGASKPRRRRPKSTFNETPYSDEDWLSESPGKLPPRKSNRPKSKSKKSKHPKSAVVFGIEMHPAVLIIAAGMVLLPSTIFIGLWMASSDPSADEAEFYVLPDNEGSPFHDLSQAELDPEEQMRRNSAEFVAGQTDDSADQARPAGRNFEDDAPAKPPVDQPPQTAMVDESPDEDQEPPTTDADSPSATQLAVANAGLTFPILNGERVTRGRTQTPRAVIGTTIWNLLEHKQVATLEGDYPSNALTALSASGTYFAAATKPPGVQGTDVVVWNTSTGKKVLTTSNPQDRFVDTVVLANDRLLLGDRWSDELFVWDLETGKQRKEVRLKSARFKQGNMSISHDGQFLAAVVNDQVRVFNSKDGSSVVTLQAPRSMSRKSERSQALYASLQSLVFSHDNHELATVTTMGATRFVCWNGRGEVVLETEPTGHFAAHDQVSWLNSRQVWLIGAHLLDRGSKKVIASVVGVAPDHAAVDVLDDSRLLVEFQSRPERLDIVDIPWDDLTRAINVSQSDPTAALKPGRKVAVRVNVPGADGELKYELTRTLKRALGDVGLQVDDVADVTFEVRVATEEESFVANRSLQLPIERRFEQLNAGLESSAVVLEVRERSQSSPIWSAVLNDDPSSLIRDAGESVSSVAEEFRKDIAAASIPYYLPTDPQFLALPALLEAPRPGEASPGRLAVGNEPETQRQ